MSLRHLNGWFTSIQKFAPDFIPVDVDIISIPITYYGSTVIINVLLFHFGRQNVAYRDNVQSQILTSNVGDAEKVNPYSAGIDIRRQIKTS